MRPRPVHDVTSQPIDNTKIYLLTGFQVVWVADTGAERGGEGRVEDFGLVIRRGNFLFATKRYRARLGQDSPTKRAGRTMLKVSPLFK